MDSSLEEVKMRIIARADILDCLIQLDVRRIHAYKPRKTYAEQEQKLQILPNLPLWGNNYRISV